MTADASSCGGAAASAAAVTAAATADSAAAEQQQQQQSAKPPRRSRRRICVLECEDAERWRGCTEALWRAALEEDGDEWAMFQACSGHLPTPAEAAAFDAMLVSGSHYSVYDDLPWIKQLLQLLPQYAATGVHIFGCCFGSQILAQALGGSVGPNPDGAFVLTIEQVTLTAQLSHFKQLGPVLQQALASAVGTAPPVDDTLAAASGRAAVGGKAPTAAAADPAGTATKTDSSSSTSSNTGDVLAVPVSEQLSNLSVQDDSSSCECAGACFRLIESHGDQVLSLPPGAVVLASSRTAPFELWAWGSNMLASQFHLEFTEQVVLDKIWSRLQDPAVGRLNSQQAADSRRALEAGGQHNTQMLQVVKHFLRRGLQ